MQKQEEEEEQKRQIAAERAKTRAILLAPLPDKVSKVMSKIDKMVLSKPKVTLEGPLSRGMGIGERLNENSESSKGQSNGVKPNREFHFRKLGNAQYTKPPEQPPTFIK